MIKFISDVLPKQLEGVRSNDTSVLLVGIFGADHTGERQVPFISAQTPIIGKLYKWQIDAIINAGFTVMFMDAVADNYNEFEINEIDNITEYKIKLGDFSDSEVNIIDSDFSAEVALVGGKPVAGIPFIIEASHPDIVSFEDNVITGKVGDFTLTIGVPLVKSPNLTSISTFIFSTGIVEKNKDVHSEEDAAQPEVAETEPSTSSETDTDTSPKSDSIQDEVVASEPPVAEEQPVAEEEKPEEPAAVEEPAEDFSAFIADVKSASSKDKLVAVLAKYKTSLDSFGLSFDNGEKLSDVKKEIIAVMEE